MDSANLTTETCHCSEAIPVTNLVIAAINAVMVVCCIALLYLQLRRWALWKEQESIIFNVRATSLTISLLTL